MNENELHVVKKYEFDKPLFQTIDSSIDRCIRDSSYKHYHIFVCKYDFDTHPTNVRNNEIIIITISNKIKNLYELNKTLKVARKNGFKFNEINKLTKKIYSHLRNINISCFLKFPMPMCHRHFF